MDYRVILWAATLSQALPVLAALRYRRQLPPARLWIAIWAAVLLLEDLAQMFVHSEMGTNQWLKFFTTPIADAIVLWALSHLQTKAFPRIFIRIGIPFFVAVWLLLALFVDQGDDFSRVAGPFRALLLLAASLYTLLNKTSYETADLARRDWFWIGLGVALYFAFGVALQPFANRLIQVSQHAVLMAYLAKAVSDTVAFMLITVGMLCPLDRTTSSQSTSPRRWESA